MKKLIISILLSLIVVTPAAAYTIQRGDTLWGLSQKYHTSVAILVKTNAIKNPNLIITGHTLIISEEAIGKVETIDYANILKELPTMSRERKMQLVKIKNNL